MVLNKVLKFFSPESASRIKLSPQNRRERLGKRRHRSTGDLDPAERGRRIVDAGTRARAEPYNRAEKNEQRSAVYRIIACDLDETLLDDEGNVPTHVRGAVAAARERGTRFVLATGRPFVSAHRTLEQLDLLGRPGESVISFNGGVITANSDERPLTTCSLDPADSWSELFPAPPPGQFLRWSCRQTRNRFVAMFSGVSA